MTEGDRSQEYLNPSFGFGDVVLRIDRNNERGVIVDLPEPGDRAKAVNVACILSDEHDSELLGVAGTTCLDKLILIRMENPWSPEQIALATARTYNMQDEGVISNWIENLELEAQKPRVSLY